MSDTYSITKEMLRDVIKQTLLDVDYDIFKEWDPDYEGREDPEGETWDNLTDKWWAYIKDAQEGPPLSGLFLR